MIRNFAADQINSSCQKVRHGCLLTWSGIGKKGSCPHAETSCWVPARQKLWQTNQTDKEVTIQRLDLMHSPHLSILQARYSQFACESRPCAKCGNLSSRRKWSSCIFLFMNLALIWLYQNVSVLFIDSVGNSLHIPNASAFRKLCERRPSKENASNSTLSAAFQPFWILLFHAFPKWCESGTCRKLLEIAVS